MTTNTAEIEARLADKADALTVRLTVGELRALLAALTAANEKLAALQELCKTAIPFLKNGDLGSRAGSIECSRIASRLEGINTGDGNGR